MKVTTSVLGKFECTTGVLVVSDPCYDLGTWGMGEIPNAKKGVWNALVSKSDEGVWGIRCAELVAVHEGLSPYDINQFQWEKTTIDVGVDSGQAGIFDKSSFKNDSLIEKDPEFLRAYRGDKPGKRWYAACCDITLSEEQAGVLSGGVVSSSGYGDGGYDCFVVKSGDEVVAVKIVFIGEDEDEGIEDDYEDEDSDDQEDEEEDQ